MRLAPFVPTLALLVAGCHSTASVDACAKLGARTCISLEIKSNSALSVDQIEVAATASPGFVPGDDATSPSPAGAAFALPVVVAILPDASFSGSFAANVRGLRGGSILGAADINGDVTPGQHLRIVATLTPPGGDVDMSVGGDDGGGDLGGTVNVAAPRPIAPLSTATVTSQTPTLRWELPAGADGAHVEFCSDRACAHAIGSFDATGSSGAPTTPLLAGVVYWRLRGRAGGGTGSAASVTWQMNVGKKNAAVNTSFGTTLDVNGDGYTDLVVPAYKAPAAAMPPISAGSGQAYLYLGATSWKTGTVPTVATTLNDPTQPSSGFGSIVASAGDINGDGFADIFVLKVPDSASGQTGKAFLFLGGPSGVAATPTTIVDPVGASDAHFAVGGTSAGDLDGDGYADLAIGAGADQFFTMGVVYIYRGGPNGLGTNPQPTWTLLQPTNTFGFGATFAGGGDINGDGYSDLAVGAGAAQNAGTSVGAVLVFHGGPTNFNATNLHPTAATTIYGTIAMANFSSPLALAGDVNADGYSDLLVGVSEPGTATVSNDAFVYFGSSTGLKSTGRATLVYPNTITERQGDLFAISFSEGADIDGDGFSDVVVGAAEYSQNKPSDNMPGPGIAVFYSGSTIGGGANIAGKSYFFATGGANGSWFGDGLRTGDFDGDGLFDLFVGSPFAMSNAGKGYVVFGVAGGYGVNAAATLTIPAPAGGDFGGP